MFGFHASHRLNSKGRIDVIRKNIIPTCLLVMAYVIVVIGIALGVTACGQDEGPFSPAGQETALSEATVTINGVQLLKAPAGLQLARLSTKEMGQSGGSIKVEGARLIVPSGALSTTTTITMANATDLWAYDFGPDGLIFDSSATLTIRITVDQLIEIGADPNDLRIAYATNGYSNDWQILGGSYDPVAEAISLPVDHFSRYSLCVE